ncbi:DUF4401 domain-containing protein [Halomonas sp. KO116]|uniref:DUF4401 domain-containing protein n=1 Tax=Halomonas sp. KO116 TaxID=1504981 RepID=UPI0004E432F6|nr:DUF4401 domain-containing protein [Halomonas sp. KO116]AJY51912.1 protein of unknown function DUF4401 [Halomonas sp. KO116]
MTNSNVDLKTKLSRAGITLNESPTSASLEPPWFVRALQAFSGWLAALFLLGFIAMGLVFVVESSAASMGLGVVMIGAAFGLFRRARGDVLEHLALAVSLAGQLLIVWALVAWWEATPYSLWSLLGWSLVGLQCVLALVMPSQVHRTFSAFAATLAFYMALATSSLAPLASGFVLLVITLLWLNEFRWPNRIKHVQAWGYGLLIGLLAIQGVVPNEQVFWFWFEEHSSGGFSRLAPWLNALFVAVSLVALLYAVCRRQSPYRFHGSIYIAPVVILLIAFYAPGIAVGVVILLLGFAIGHRPLVGIGVFSLLMGMGSYYYWLDTTLFVKALSLLIMGLSMLTLRWLLHKRLPQRESEHTERGRYE